VSKRDSQATPGTANRSVFFEPEDKKAMRVIFVRHGQSTGNAGIPAHDLSLLELTELGWRQSREVARRLDREASLIVTSPYLRTQQTAAPTIERFPDVGVEIWPIQEFTYLEPSRWNGTLSAARMPVIEHYWAEADPAYATAKAPRAFRLCCIGPRPLSIVSRSCRRTRWSTSSATVSSSRPCGRSGRRGLPQTDRRARRTDRVF
jgi:hypothetical protein